MYPTNTEIEKASGFDRTPFASEGTYEEGIDKPIAVRTGRKAGPAKKERIPDVWVPVDLYVPTPSRETSDVIPSAGQTPGALPDELDREIALAFEFDRLVEQWRSETAFYGTIMEICTHRAYQRIIGMGRVAVPFILRELKARPEHWFWALRAITRQDPVPKNARGDLRAMTAAWLTWGAKNGYET